MKILKGADIKELREKMGLTQEKFGELIGKKYRTIQTYEAGTSVPGGNAMLKIQELYAQYFGQNVQSVDEGDNELFFIKEGVTVTMNDIVNFADKNYKDFFDQRYIKREIDLKVAKKLYELSNDKDKLREFLAG